MPKTSFKELLDAGVHFGHLKRKWNPNMAPYIFMERNGIHIIDLRQTVTQVADAIEQHYRPRFSNDTVPEHNVAACVALADKIDMLTGFWAIDEKPTGSGDPYQLRRAALGVIRTVLENDLRMPLVSAAKAAAPRHTVEAQSVTTETR